MFEDDQGPVFDPNKEEHLDLLTALATIELPNIKKLLPLEKGLLKITDDNLATEYKLDSEWYNADWKWSNLFERLMPGQ